MVISHEPINKSNVKDILFLFSLNFWNLDLWIILYFPMRNVKHGILSTDSLILSPVPDTSMLTFLKFSFLHFLKKIPFGNMLNTSICSYVVFLSLSNARVNKLPFYEGLELIYTLFPQDCRARELCMTVVCVKKGFCLFWPNVSGFTNLTYWKWLLSFFLKINIKTILFDDMLQMPELLTILKTFKVST